MPHILDHLRKSPSKFRPETIKEFLALQLVRKLGDTAKLPQLLALARQHSEEVLLRAYRRALKRSRGSEDLSERFQIEIASITQKEDYGPSQTGRAQG